MRQPDRNQALQRAAHYRPDVRRFTVSPGGGTFTATFYDRDPAEGEIVWGDYGPDTTLREVLGDLLGEEPPVRGQRDAALLDHRDQCRNQRLGDLR